ncbi:hypothetical protein MTBBW1_2030008 [Desulfamplus magnetovallimortis]|uniref:Uncharacterized protein n=1 Tax=Desulfamplus magnetovallimortis TaxID=1246637 RepID=A0A1W1HC12_9BACT|nr:hypothetical protein MTBBW1_2030008 [Desulfamplus magnetovallimortis]
MQITLKLSLDSAIDKINRICFVFQKRDYHGYLFYPGYPDSDNCRRVISWPENF